MKKWGRYLLNWNRSLYVLKAPEIIIRHLPVAFKPGLVQLRSLVFPHLIIMKQLVHVFPVLPYASKQHMQIPVTLALLLPGGQWDTRTFPKRFVLWSDELGNQRPCLHPAPPAELLCSQPHSHKAVLCSSTAKLPTAWDLTFVLVFSCLP